MDILSPDEEASHDLVERYDRARLRLWRLWRERNAAERRVRDTEKALTDFREFHADYSVHTAASHRVMCETVDDLDAKLETAETERLAYAKQVAIATEALRKEHAEALAAAKKNATTALESLDRAYGWLTTACAERDDARDHYSRELARNAEIYEQHKVEIDEHCDYVSETTEAAFRLVAERDDWKRIADHNTSAALETAEEAEQILAAAEARDRAAREALAHYAKREHWDSVEEFDCVGWMYGDDDLPWAVAVAALGEE